MPACEKCGAHVGADGKWAPAEHLLRTSQERDTAVKQAQERWMAVQTAIALLEEATDAPGGVPDEAKTAGLATEALALLKAVK